MFSGIIDNIGVIERVATVSSGRTVTVAAPGYWDDVPLGASIAIDGVCLTVTRRDEKLADFDVVAETLQRSTLGELSTGSKVNLQKSLAVGDRIDGHFVQGHVDAVGTISRIERGDLAAMWWFECDAKTMRLIVPKGSITIDGISLTVAGREVNQFAVALIPTTLNETTIGGKNIGDRVNLETDILVRTVAHLLDFGSSNSREGGITTSLLESLGFK